MELEQALKRILDLENENKLMTDEITSLKVVNEKLNTEIENKDVKINDLKQSLAPQFSELSIGMSNDYKIAKEEGSTLVRIGTYIFGERDYGI